MEIAAFGQYLAYQIGGAELATIELLNKEAQKGQDIQIKSFENLTSYGVAPKSHQFPIGWEVELLKRKHSFVFFPFIEYCLNRKWLLKWSEQLSADQLFAFSIYAPPVINGFLGNKAAFYIQSVIVLGIPQNQETGWKKIAKHLYNLIESPFRWQYRRDLRKTLQKANVICNSQFTARKVREQFGIACDEIIPPSNNLTQLQEDYQLVKDEIKEKGIVFIGDRMHKGLEIALAVANAIPNQPFFFFSKKEKQTRQQGNITFMPWQSCAADVYKHAKLVIMPSLCEESFGRVARESYSLGIPTLVSAIGGLPEAVFFDTSSMIGDFRNPKVWVQRINEKLNSVYH